MPLCVPQRVDPFFSEASSPAMQQFVHYGFSTLNCEDAAEMQQ